MEILKILVDRIVKVIYFYFKLVSGDQFMRCKACNELIDEGQIQDEVYTEYNKFLDSGLCHDCYVVDYTDDDIAFLNRVF